MEKWRNIKGYEKLYQISDLGRVRSLDKKILHLGSYRTIKGKIIKSHINSKGYYRIDLHDNKKKKKYLISRLVGFAFISIIKNKPNINHKDGNAQNNNASNLEWCTQKENVIHAMKMGLMKMNGEDNPQSKLTEKQVIEIRNKYKSGDFHEKELAIKYGINSGTISEIINRKLWRHI